MQHLQEGCCVTQEYQKLAVCGVKSTLSHGQPSTPHGDLSLTSPKSLLHSITPADFPIILWVLPCTQRQTALDLLSPSAEG